MKKGFLRSSESSVFLDFIPKIYRQYDDRAIEAVQNGRGTSCFGKGFKCGNLILTVEEPLLTSRPLFAGRSSVFSIASFCCNLVETESKPLVRRPDNAYVAQG